MAQHGEGNLPPDVNRGAVLLGVNWALCPLALAAAALRIYVRLHYTKHLGVDDYLIVAAVAFLIINSAINIPIVQNGIGRHIMYIDPRAIPYLAELNFWAQPVNVLTLTLAKLSITFFLVRLRLSLYLKALTYLAVFLVTVTFVFDYIIFFAQCRPLSLNWNPMEPGSCWSRSIIIGAAYLTAAVAAFTDWVYIIVPIIYTWRVQMNPRAKHSVWALLSLGVLSAICSIVKIPYITVLENSEDFTWNIVDFAVWNVCEVNFAIITACIPPMKPLLERFLPGLFYKSAQRSSYPLVGRNRNGVYASPGITIGGSRRKDHGSETQLEYSDQVPLSTVSR